MTQELTRNVIGQVDNDKSLTYLSVTTSEQDKIRARIVDAPKKVIPIIFIPGIMASRLRSTDNGKFVWNPPNTTWEEIKAATSYSGKNPAQRQQELNPETTRVDNESLPYGKDKNIDLQYTPIHLKDAVERARWRGWGTIFGKAYASILDTLEGANVWIEEDNKNNNKGRIPGRWRKVLEKQNAKTYNGKKANSDYVSAPGKALGAVGKTGGALEDFVSLSEEDLRSIAKADIYLPVYALGYNWLKSNRESAAELGIAIDKIIAFYKNIINDPPIDCEKVILVTHSMGGLVARLAVQNAEIKKKVLGVVHGVMPATGAPKMYKANRGGFDGASAVVLGWNANEVVAVSGSSPATLELLPMDDYNPEYDPLKPNAKKQPWLRAAIPLTHFYRDQYEYIPLGNPDDQLNSIYLANSEQKWWRLVKEELLNPLGKERRKKKSNDPYDDGIRSDFDMHMTAMTKATAVRNDLRNVASTYHANTYAYYEADPDKKSYHVVDWLYMGVKRNCLLTKTHQECTREIEDNYTGTLKVIIEGQKHVFNLDTACGAGDETVPAGSGAAPTIFCRQMFRHGGETFHQPSYAHDESYKSEIAEDVTLYSVAKIVLDSLTS